MEFDSPNQIKCSANRQSTFIHIRLPWHISNTNSVVCYDIRFDTKIQEKFEKLVQETSSSSKVQVYGYTNEVPELMSISDLVVTKPGGLTTTESLASGLPIVAINPIPGQEVENAQYLESQGIAVWIRPKEDPNETIQELLSNEQELKHMKIRSKLAAKKNSTRDICSIIFCNAN